MQPFYKDNHDTLYCMDFRKNDLLDESVQCVVTSPPYWGLRKYSGEQDLIWGGDKACVHQWNIEKISAETWNRDGHVDFGDKNPKRSERPDRWQTVTHERGFCSLCGAWKGAYGLEPTPEMYVEHTIEILKEIKRVLRPDGVVFWNIGDSYATHASGGKGYAHNFRSPDVAIREGIDQPKPTAKSIGLKEKDLCLIPFRVAIAAQTDGWWIRSDIIWSKPNPMPESVTDRPTNSHEHILMLTKSAKYYWGQEAVREERQGNTHSRGKKRTPPIESAGIGHEDWCKYMTKDEELVSRNIRSVWEFPTQPYPEAHFAVFPEKLPEICIKAATPEVGCCSKCGAPWERVIERTGHTNKREPAHVPDNTPTKTDSTGWGPVAMGTNNWQPTCKCNADKVPSIVLDPFNGAGTVLKVAKKLNRRATGFDTSEEYCQLTVERLRQQGLL